MTPGGCGTCGETYDNDDFGTDGNGYLILIHICSRAAMKRLAVPLPRYEHLRDYGAASCQRCGRWIRKQRQSHKWCVECSALIRKEQDAERHARNRHVA